METVKFVIGTYVRDLCEGLRIATLKGIAYMIIGDREYPVIEGTIPPTIQVFLRDGHMTFYAFWREDGTEHEAFIKAALTKMHILENTIYIEPHGALEKFDASVVLKLDAPKEVLKILKKIVDEERLWTIEEESEVASTYLEEYLKNK
ncbi:hypothetical protein A3L04_00885 [Thermococcus chitonophagus]|uniref:Uncharacterized protein n=1 Tax=Thermococcus chitonophagus TaxID=54262 RepID=A0A161KIE0_9EURY|nr:hypothetical protein [Thermococcus chitonophagus]ASJ15729.1 hypothetical protein A3L04_00885 [Thermococcus chitonophagus]CUX76948.1 hypothetical protein CHITON_0169 [Thermococcus chitonophagus]